MKYFYTLCLLLTLSFSGYSQSGNIQGIITDENGIAVPGASVLIEVLNKGAVTDFDGKFTLVDVPEGKHEILVKYLGYADVKQEVEVTSGSTTTLNLTLSSKTPSLILL